MRRIRAVLAGAAILALSLPVAAGAGVRLNGVDFGAYPQVGATVVTSTASTRAPNMFENGRRVVGLQAVNLGRCKNVVLALDSSRSMAGKPLAAAAAAATAFVASKPACDRITLVTFGRHASQQGAFSSATIDADNALRTLAVGANSGTALWDAVDLSARLLASQPGGRVLVLLTDGNDVGSQASEDDALSSLHHAGAVVYPIAFGSKADASGLKRLASQTGGSFHGAAAGGTLTAIYSSIARELRRTWRVRYLTTARPGDKLDLKASVGRLGADHRSVAVPDPNGEAAAGSKPSPILPSPLYGKLGDLFFTLLAAMLILAAGILFASTLQGSWLKRRLAPHIDSTRRKSKRRVGRERLEVLNGLFRATENTFGHRPQWRNLQLLLQRADLPLRTVEFTWLLIGCSFGLALLTALAGRSSLAILAMFLVGGSVPYLVVWFKAKRRMRAFEDQLPDLLITMDCRANRLEELLVRDHSRQHPAAGRRLSRRTVRHGRRHRSRPATVRAQDPLADRDGPRLGLRAGRTALLHRCRGHVAEPDLYGPALPLARRAHVGCARPDDDGVRVTHPQKDRLLQGVTQ
ncbi:MAG: VWA domain-containing protein [Actinobacteria bacterium]|nr:MAG: VWA domain-containing protein [Actinomycetota bacterium]